MKHDKNASLGIKFLEGIAFNSILTQASARTQHERVSSSLSIICISSAAPHGRGGGVQQSRGWVRAEGGTEQGSEGGLKLNR